jgi:hypothetical protein
MPRKSGHSGKVSRRSAIALIAGGGLAGLSGVGAFDQVEADRRFGANTVSDEDALLGIDIPAKVSMQVGSSKKLFTLENQTGVQLSVQVESLEDWLEIESSVSPPNSTTLSTDGGGSTVDISGTVSSGGGGTASVQINATEVATTSSESSISIQLTRSIPINATSGSGEFIIGITNKKKVELYEATNTGNDTVTKIFPTEGYSKAGGAVRAIGTIGSDIDADGNPDLVAIKNKNKIMFVDEDGKIESVKINSAKADTQKTTLSTGSWNGYDVFYSSKNHDKIYGINQTSAGWAKPDEIVAPGNGVNGILPPADIDNDGIDELVFADGSQHIRYVDKNLNITKVTSGGVGSSNNIGVGPVATIDGRTLMPTVDGSNNIKFLGPPKSGSGTVKKRAVFKGVDAAKSRITVADIDRDGELEVVYLTNSNQKLRYIDNIDISEGSFDSYDVLYDDSSITGEKKRGVV